MANSSWKSGVNGDWGTSVDWTGPVPNSAASIVTIAAAGTYMVTIGASESFTAGSLAINDSGADLAIAGTLSLGSGLTLTAGSLTGAGTLTLTGGTLQGASGFGLSLANLAINTAKTVTLGSSLTDTGGLTMTAGTFALGANTLTLGSFAQNYGTISGTGKLIVTGAASLGVNFSDLLETGTGTTLLEGATSFYNDDPGYYGYYFGLDGGRILENAGTLTVTGSGGYFFELGYNPFGTNLGGATLKNDSGGIFDIQTSGYIVQSNTGTTAFTNAGTLEQTVTTGTSYIKAPFTNTGKVSVQSGTLEFDQSFTNSGAVAVGSGAELNLNGGGSSSAGTFTIGPGGVVQFGSSFTFTGGTYNGGSGSTSITTGEVDFSGATITSFGAQGLDLSGGTLELGGQNATASSLTQQPSIIDGTGTLTVTANASLSDYATETGSGTTVLQGTTTASGNYISLDAGRVLENQGIFNWTGYLIYLGYNPYFGNSVGGGTIQNDAGATFNIQNDSSIASEYGTNAFINNGTLTKSVTTGTTNIQAPFTNTGTVTVQSGTLEFDGGFTNTGTVSVAAGTELNLNTGGSSSAGAFSIGSGAEVQFGSSGTFTFTGGTYNASAGSTSVTGGEVDFSAATITSLGTLSLSGGTLELGGQNASAASLTQQGSVIDGTGTLTVSGNASLINSYATETGTGTTLLQGTTTASGNYISLDAGRVLENQGIFNWTGYLIYLGSNPYFGNSVGGGTIQNDAGATFNIQNDSPIYSYYGTNAFINNGTLTKSVTTGTTNIDAPFTNTGTVSVQSGTLEFDGGFTNSGTVSVAAGTELNLNGGGSSSAGAFAIGAGGTVQFGPSGTFTFTGGTYNATGASTSLVGGEADFSAVTITSLGALSLSGGTLELGGQNASAASLTQQASVIDGTGTLTVTGNASLIGNYATETGTGTTLLQGTTTASGNYISLDAGRVLENQGIFNWTGYLIYLGSNPYFGNSVGGGTIQNDAGATFNIQNDSPIYSYYGTNAFINNGTLTKSVTTGTTNIYAAVTDTGTISAQTGTLEFDGGGTFTGAISGNGTVAFGGSLDQINAGTTLSVKNLLVDGAEVQIAPNLTYSGAFSETSGDLNLGAGSTFTLSGATLSGGTIDGAGTLVTGGATSITGYNFTLGTTSWTNSGTLTIAANLYGIDLGVAGNNWANTGTIAANTDGITFDGNWTTPGTVSIKNSSLTFNGTFKAAVLDQLSGKGDTLRYGGNAVVDNTGHTIKVGSSSNPLGTTSIGFTIENGIINDASGLLNYNNGTLDGVTYQGTLNVNTYNSSVNIYHGLTLVGSSGTGAGTLNLEGDESYLNFDGTQTLDNATINIGGTAPYGGYTAHLVEYDAADGSPGILTFGKNLRIVSAGFAKISSYGADGIINNGSITASTSGYVFLIDSVNFTNNGSISVSNSDTLNLDYSGEADNFINATPGTITLNTGTTANLGASDSTSTNAGTITATSATVNFDGTWTNTGTLNINKSNVTLDGTFTGTAFIALLGNKTDTVTFNGVYNNAGQTLTVGTGTTLGSVPLAFTVQGGTIVDQGKGFTFNRGTLQGVTYQGTLDMTSSTYQPILFIVGGLTVTGAGGTGPGTIQDTGYYGSQLYFQNTQTIDNATINIGNNNDTCYIYLQDTAGTGQTLTLGKNLIIDHVGANAYLTSDAYAGDTIVNNGTINASDAGGTFDISPMVFTNQGTITVSNGDTLDINVGTFANTGTITVAAGSTIDFQSDITTAQLAGITNSGGTLEFDGTLDNTGATLNFGSGTVVVGNGGTILNGTIIGTELTGDGGTLDGVAYQGTIDLSGYSASLTIADGLTMAGAGGTGPGTINDTGGYSDLAFASTETVSNATINIGDSLDNGIYSFSTLLETDANGVLTLASTVMINQTGVLAAIGNHGFQSGVGVGTIINDGSIVAGVGVGAAFYIGSDTFTNNGSIAVSNGDDLYIEVSSFSNTGAITVADGSLLDFLGSVTTFTNTGSITLAAGSRLDFQGNVTTAQLETINAAAGSVEIDGTLNNAGATLNVGAGTALGSLNLYGTITGGTIVDAGGAISYLVAATLDGVTYQGTLNLSFPDGILTIVDGLTMTGAGGVGPGTINDINTGGGLYIQGTETLDNATINLGNYGSDASYLYLDDTSGTGAVLTLGPNLIIDQIGYASLGSTGGSAADTIVNDGTINATGGSFTINPSAFTNNSSITASNYGSLYINGATFTNSGSIVVSTGGTLLLQPTNFTNLSSTTLTGGYYEVDAGSTIDLANNARIVTDSARIELSGAGSVIQSYKTSNGTYVQIDSTLTTVTATGVLKIVGARNWTTSNAMTNNGSLVLGGGLFTAAKLTNAAGADFSGYGTVATPIVNAGTIEASAGLLTLQGAVTGTGGFQIDAGATLALAAAVPGTAGILFNGVGAALALTPSAGFTNVLTGMVAGDGIDLLKTAATGAALNNAGQLVVTNNGTTVATFNLGGSTAGSSFFTTPDGKGGTFVVVGTPQVPATTVPGGQLVQAGGSVALTGLSVTDIDAVLLGRTITVTISDSAGILSATPALSGATVTGAGTNTLTLSGGLTQVNAELATLTYSVGTTGLPLTDTITVATNDGAGGSNTQTIGMSLNQPPVTSVPASLAIVDGVVTPIAGISVADADAIGAGETLSVVISDTTGLISATLATGGTVSGAGTNTLTLTGGLVALNAELASLTYAAPATGAPGTDTLTIATNDGRGGSNTATVGITLDQPPVTTLPAALLIQTGTVTPIAGVSVADPDAVSLGQTITVVLSDTAGLLSATASAGATVAGGGTNALTLSGRLVAVDAELATLSYDAPTAGAPLTDTITVATNDGAGGSNTGTIAVTLNQPPANTAPATLSAITGTPTPVAGVSVADGDAVSAGETITVKLTDTVGLLSAKAEAGATVSGSGTKALTLTGSLAGVDAELATLVYKGVLTGTAASTTDTITIVTADGRGGTATSTIAVKINHVPPVVTAAPAFKVLSGQTVSLGGYTVNDTDPLSVGGKFTVTLTDKHGALSATAETGATVTGAGTTKLVLAGSLAGVQAELATLTYTGGTTGTKATVNDIITINAQDSRSGTATARSTNVTIDHLPPVTTVPGPVKVASNVATPIAGISVADADPTAGSAVFKVTLTDKLGLLSATAAAGGTVAGNDSKKLTLSGSLAAVDAELATLTYKDKLSGAAASASDTITVTTADNHGLGDKHTIGVTVTPTGALSPAQEMQAAQANRLAVLIQSIAAFSGAGAGHADYTPRLDDTPHWLAHGH